MRAYARPVSFQRLLAFLTALAVLLAPAFGPAAAASVGPADHHEQMMKTGHCESMPEEDSDKGSDKSCCAKICMAVEATMAGRLQVPALPASAEIPALDSFFLGMPAEIATPPPRAA